jgi:predicted ATPase
VQGSIKGCTVEFKNARNSGSSKNVIDQMSFLLKAKTIGELPNEFPFTIPSIQKGFEIDFKTNVTFLVGENGSGKSTILEGIADLIGFNLSGGNKNHMYDFHKTESNLASNLRLSWRTKIAEGFFMRAESFFNFASYIDEMEGQSPGMIDGYGGKSLHHQSHGESFLSLFTNRFNRGIYILDEPEAALSPNRQLAFLALINALETSGKAQFIIATHSPILLTYPGSKVISLDEGMQTIPYQDTEHFKLTTEFLNDPEAYYKHLFRT